MKFDVHKIQQNFQKVSNGISNNIYLKAMMGGMMAAMPATIIGAIASLLKSLPIKAYQSFLTANGIDKILQLPVTFTTNIMALIFVVCITYSLAEAFEVKGLGPAVVALVSFLLLTPINTMKDKLGQTATTIPMDWLGSMGIFSAIIVAFITGRLYVYIVKKGWTIKMPESVPPFVKESFASLIPGAIITGLFLIISAVFANTEFKTMHAVVYKLIQIPLQHVGGSFGAMVLIAILCQLFWICGIHAIAVLSVVMPIWMAMDTAQLSAYSAGRPLPNVIGMNFFGICTTGGTALGLAILMLVAKSKRFKTLGKIAIVPAIFGITEPLIFGTPLILNPMFAIPFIFGQALTVVVGYAATVMGIIPRLSGVGAPMGTPIIVQGLIAGGWRVAIFQAVMIVAWVAWWYPFFKIADKRALAQESGEAQ